MARNYYGRARSFYNRQRYMSLTPGTYQYRARGVYRKGRRFASRANQTIGLYNPGVEYLAGVGVGVTDLDNRIPAVVKILCAALPLRGGIGGKVCRFFRGMLIGDAISHYTGVKFNVPVVGDGNNSNIKWG